MKQYFKYTLTAVFGLLVKILSLHVTTTTLNISYYVAYPAITLLVILINYAVISRAVFSVQGNVKSTNRLFKFTLLSAFSLCAGWVIASLLYSLTQSIIIATTISGAATTTINFLVSKRTIWTPEATN